MWSLQERLQAGTIGTSDCKQCTNSHLILLIPFAVMGVALVFLLLVCKLTVATGTLSGLVLYANIIGVNRTIFLPEEPTSVFSVFIAWLNLDFGIETCFYNGLDDMCMCMAVYIHVCSCVCIGKCVWLVGKGGSIYRVHFMLSS